MPRLPPDLPSQLRVDNSKKSTYLGSKVASGVDVHWQAVDEVLIVDTGAHAGIPTNKTLRRVQGPRQQLQQGSLAWLSPFSFMVHRKRPFWEGLNDGHAEDR